MLGFHEKRRIQRILFSRYALVVLCVPVGFVGYAAHNAYTSERQSHAQKAALEVELAALEQRASALEADIVRLEDPYGVEEELRKRYDVGREGEEAIILVESSDQEEVQSTSAAPKPTLWDKVRSWF